MAGRPPKPLEQKRLLGNPGQRPLPKEGELMLVEGGRVDPVRPLDWAGQQMWDSVFNAGQLWVSSRTDVQLLQLVCEQLDRKVQIEGLIAENPSEWHMFKQLNDLERMISNNLSLLGFTPSDRTRLGLAEVKRQSKLEALIAKRND
jgi:hypothetical protein